MTILNPFPLQAKTYSAHEHRYAREHMNPGEGVDGYDDYRVTQRGAGANMSVDVAAGVGNVRGDDSARQGLYVVTNDGTVNVPVAAAHATLPRLDQIVLHVRDGAPPSGQAGDNGTLEAVAGTATSGATLDNRTGAAALPATAMLLADVIVGAADTSITDSEIRDRRSFSKLCVPPLLTDLNVVGFVPVSPAAPGVAASSTSPGATHSYDLRQSAALMWLPRRIAGVTRIRWRYLQEATPLAGNYVLALFDASGRWLLGTGSVAFTGAANSTQERSEAITAITLEPGLYYLFIGIDTSAGSAVYPGVALGAGAGAAAAVLGARVRNECLYATSGGLTVPTTLLGLTDQAVTPGNAPSVPLVTLSVG